MRHLSPKSLLAILWLAFAAFGVVAQDGPPPEEASQFAPQRTNLLENLGLTENQIRQIRSMNRDRKPRMEAAQQRLREASRALDVSIYGDTLDEAAVDARLTEFQQAQAEVAKIRFQSEMELRKILTPEQLSKFRVLRARAAESRRKLQQLRRQRPPGERPLQRIRQIPRRQRVN